MTLACDGDTHVRRPDSKLCHCGKMRWRQVGNKYSPHQGLRERLRRLYKVYRGKLKADEATRAAACAVFDPVFKPPSATTSTVCDPAPIVEPLGGD